jgi:hypothetical protein
MMRDSWCVVVVAQQHREIFSERIPTWSQKDQKWPTEKKIQRFEKNFLRNLRRLLIILSNMPFQRWNDLSGTALSVRTSLYSCALEGFIHYKIKRGDPPHFSSHSTKTQG